ncbi:hypothetical protein F5050DRAFT_1810002 [Lentinula boryana]|uniref:Uncharacterized protein n=1 Tax=Lentinula boryana TaxID=40481 RepID=A0ABQ8Q6E2_9AGAR|nr:hypothetical protein F5050DRAFT_1810002 [Lentinula boryana]
MQRLEEEAKREAEEKRKKEERIAEEKRKEEEQIVEEKREEIRKITEEQQEEEHRAKAQDVAFQKMVEASQREKEKATKELAKSCIGWGPPPCGSPQAPRPKFKQTRVEAKLDKAPNPGDNESSSDSDDDDDDNSPSPP